MARVLVCKLAVLCQVFVVVGILGSVTSCDIARITGHAPNDENLPRYSLMSFDREPSAPEVVSVVVTEPETPAVAKQDFKSVVSDELLGADEQVVSGGTAQVDVPTVTPERVGGVTETVALTRSGIDERNAHFEALFASLPRAYDKPEWVSPLSAPERVQKIINSTKEQKLVARPYREPWFPIIYIVYMGVALGVFGAFLGILAIRLRYSED